MVKMKARFACFVLVIVLIGCNPLSPFIESGAHPGEQGIPIQGSPSPSIIPTPIASKGTVIGKLVSANPGRSLVGIALYFGTLLPLTPGPDHLMSMDVANSPKTNISDDGSFMVKNITPGAYVLILWTPHDSSYVPDPTDSEKALVVEVVGGKVVNLGTLQALPPP